MSLKYNDQRAPANSNHNDLEKAWRVKLIIEKDYYKSLTVEDLASAVGTNKSTLNVLFHRITNMPVKQYLLWHRIEIAKQLLINTNHSIKYIASKVGISRRNFERQFKKLVNKTPVEWRNQPEHESTDLLNKKTENRQL